MDLTEIKFEIPKISDERLAELEEQIVPLVRSQEGRLHHINTGQLDLRNQSFQWDAELLGEADDKLRTIGTFATYHTYGYYMFFKPSIAEVLAQIPDELLDKAIAYEVVGPRTAAQLDYQSEALKAGFHIGKTTAYGLSQD